VLLEGCRHRQPSTGILSQTMFAKVSLAIVAFLMAVTLPSCAGVADSATVLQVIDGDTIVIEGGHHIRYIGIDTPEKGQAYYEEAGLYNQELVAGRTLRLETDVTNKDKFGRFLRYIYVGDLFVNLELVKQGYAEVYPKQLFPDNKHYDLLKAAETEAREAERGIWSNPA